MHHAWWLGLGWIGTFSLLGAACSLQTSGLSSATSESSTSSSGASSSASSSSAGSGGNSSGTSTGSGGGGGGTGAGGSDGGATGMGGGGGGGGTGAGGDAGPPIVVAGALLVDLDAQDLNTGAALWPNKGTLSGAFMAQGQPKLVMNGSLKAIEFDGKSAAYIGPKSVSSIEGNSDRSIELWVNNPAIGQEEAMVSWSDRDKPNNGTMMSFNYGVNTSFGAVTHWGPLDDLSWGQTSGDAPSPGVWHHLVYTFDGTTARVYADGIEKNAKAVMINTRSGSSINLAAERNKNGFELYGSLQIAVVRIHDGALTAAQVKSNFDAERPQFP